VTAATVSYITTGTEAMFKFHLDQAFEMERIPYVIMLGIFCGLVSLYFTRAMNSVEGVFGKLKGPYQKLALGGIMLSILIFLFPPLYGEGYDTIELLLNGTSNADWDTVMNNSFFYGHGNLLLLYLMLIVLLRCLHPVPQTVVEVAVVFLHPLCIWVVLQASSLPFSAISLISRTIYLKRILP